MTSSLALAIVLAVVAATADSAAEPPDARRLLLTGRYEEAEQAYQKLQPTEPVRAALGVARCRLAVGRGDAAEDALRQALTKQPESAELRAELADIAFHRGDYPAAQKLVREALKTNDNQVLARYLVAELHRAAGELAEARQGYRWLIEFHNRQPALTAEEADLVGLAAAQDARWSRNSSQFRFLVSTLYPGILKQDERYWPAHLAAAMLFLEKYNQPDAKAELDAALAINSRAAELHVVRAGLALQDFELARAKQAVERALEINPRCLAALHMQADLLLADLHPADAIPVLERARKLNPVHEGTLGRLAAAYGAVDGFQKAGPQSRLAKLQAEVTARNPHAGEFFAELASSCDLMRRYPAAARFYRQAEQAMPELMYTRGQLGLILMRLGEEAEAARLLDEAFAADPFNVRVKNMLEVLDLLEEYGTLETDHFILRFDPQKDAVLAQAASRYLERAVYPAVVRELGYQPPRKSLIEIFNRAKGTSGHGWFSARMTGLPVLGTVGACAGQMAAIVSPNAMPQKFNWARVLKHEFIHVVTLQQTDFNIPHWYTEGLAVYHENLPRPELWNTVLARRAAADKLFNLETINLGFIRRQTHEDVALAYCQAELYVEFMLEKYGPGAPGKLLAAYGANRATPAALQECFGVAPAEFERAYRQYVDRIVARAKPAGGPRAANAGGEKTPAPTGHKSFAELQHAVEEDPKNADRWAELAQQYLNRRDLPNARRCAQAARKLSEKHALAGYVLARLHVAIGDTEAAIAILRQTLDEQTPHEDVLTLLAALQFQAGQHAEAERLYRLGLERFSYAEPWHKALVRVYLKTGDQRKLSAALRRLAELDHDNLLVRKKLLDMAVEAKDSAGAEQWANEVLAIDVTDAEVHAALAQALSEQKKYREAADAWAVALQLVPDRTDWREALDKARGGISDKP